VVGPHKEALRRVKGKERGGNKGEREGKKPPAYETAQRGNVMRRGARG